MNYNDIKNLNISKRGKKELLNALNKGGGSGAGVIIVDSVDKLDENDPVGSMAVIAPKDAGGKLISLSEMNYMDNDDVIIDGENEIVTLLSADSLTSVKTVKCFNPQKFDIPYGIGFMGVLVNKHIVNRMLTGMSMGEFNNILNNPGGEGQLALLIAISDYVDPNNTDLGTMIGFSIVVVDDSIMNSLGSLQDTLIVSYSEVNGLQLNTEYLDLVNTQLANDDFYILFVRSMSGGNAVDLESLKVFDNIVKIGSGNIQESKVYIKNYKWENFIDEKIESIKLNIKTASKKLEQNKADVIKIVNSNTYTHLLPNTYYVMNYSNYDLTLNLANYYDTNYKEYMFEIYSSRTTTIKFADENNEELPIKWVDGNPPTLVANATCLISILNGFGVYVII